MTAASGDHWTPPPSSLAVAEHLRHAQRAHVAMVIQTLADTMLSSPNGNWQVHRRDGQEHVGLIFYPDHGDSPWLTSPPWCQDVERWLNEQPRHDLFNAWTAELAAHCLRAELRVGPLAEWPLLDVLRRFAHKVGGEALVAEWENMTLNQSVPSPAQASRPPQRL